MLDAGAFNTGIKIVAQLVGIVAMQLAAQKGGDIFRLDGVDGRAGQMIVNAVEILLTFEHDIGGIFGLPSCTPLPSTATRSDWVPQVR